MGKRHNIVENDNRIVYVDPNDIHGKINGVPTTPDYTDFCIWCNLIVERSSRLKNQAGGTDKDEKYSIYFDLTKADNGTEYVSFMRGKDAERYNFLSTDYTEIDFDEVRKRNIIEGLQIESISINFVNYQTPQVAIKFIDIRGGGFFGREEATHNEFGKLTNLEMDQDNKMFDNFFSCFVSFPYPRFRLQVKGFYGKPVTFQLTCTSFSGKFNAQTGNFEITTQFIGYEYGILGDIPFDFLVAAPLTETGRVYWNNHVANMRNNGWALDAEGTEEPYLLYDFYNNVAAATQGLKEGEEMSDIVLDENLNTNIAIITKQKEQIGKILDNIKTFRTKVKDAFEKNGLVVDFPSTINGESFSTAKEEAAVVFVGTETVTDSGLLAPVCESYNDLAISIEEYVKEYGDTDKVITSKLIPNTNKDGSWDEWSPNETMKFSHFIMKSKTPDNGGLNVTLVGFDGLSMQTKAFDSESSCVNFKIGKMGCNSTYAISDGMSQEIFKKKNVLVDKNLQYALTIDFNNITNILRGYLTDLTIKYNEYTEQLKDPNRKSIKDIVGFTPYIGRYFKVVMCHLETFVNLVNTCAQAIDGEINKGKREPGLLGIRNLDVETDVPRDVFYQVPPFPALFKNYKTDEEAEENLNNSGIETVVTNAWIGDFRGETKWQEKTLVDDLFRAIQRITTARKENSEATASVSVVNNRGFITPNPIDRGTVPHYAYTTVDGALFYAALKAETTLNILQGGNKLDSGDALKLGMIDAYNYYQQTTNKTRFKNTFKGITKIDDEIYNSTVYCPEFKNSEKHLFETTDAHEGRHPVFVEDGNLLEYKYMTNIADETEVIPLNDFETFKKYDGFSEDFPHTDGVHFTPKDDSVTDYLVGYTGYTSPSATFSEEFKKAQNFNIVVDEEEVEYIKRGYQHYTNDKFAIAGKKSSEFVKTLEYNMKVGVNDIAKYYDSDVDEQYKSYNELRVNVGNLNTNMSYGDFKAFKNKFKNTVKQ